MPIYEYQCQSCGYEMEALQKVSDAPLKDCPACQEPQLSKLISAASFRLKGGGWYETDFKTGDKKQLADSDSKTSADSGKSSSAEGKAKDAKPETKSNEKSSQGEKSKPANAS